MVSFLDRLKQRKLFQWALAYAAGAWALLEGVDLVGGQFGWPQRLLQSITVLVAVGFFVVLVLAWYHGEKGQQRVSGPELLLIAGLLAIAAGMTANLARPDAYETDSSDAAAVFVTGSLGPASIAVLPFTGSSATEEGQADFYVDGIHSEILTQLTKIGAIEVVGPASLAYYAATKKSLQELGRELGVASVAVGTVLRAEDQLRVNIQLTDVRSGRQLWADAYLKDLTTASVFEIQAEIASEVARALGVVLSPEEQIELAAAPTKSLEAYESYLRGRKLFQEDRWGEAMAAFEQAVTLDSLFAAAWAGLSVQGALAYYTGSTHATEDLEKAREALAWAQRLAPESVESLVAQAVLGVYIDLDYESATALLALARRQRPNDVRVIEWQATTLRHAGQWEEAIELLKRAVTLDPMDAEAAHSLGGALRYTRRYAEAMRYLDRAAQSTPHDPILLRERFRAALWGIGDSAKARAVLDERPNAESLEGEAQQLRRQLAWVRRDVPALTRWTADSLWAEPASPDRYYWLQRLQVLKTDSIHQAIYTDSLIAARRVSLNATLQTEAGPFRDLLVGLIRSQLAEALASRGNASEAIPEAELAAQLVPRSLNGVNGHLVYYHLVLTHTFLGYKETAIDRIEHELRLPGQSITVERLRLDPDFDALRDDPRFQVLLNKPPSVN